MKRLFLLFLLANVICLSARADSGGPYVGVPDATAAEKGPVFQIPQSAKPLRYYLTNMPQLTWNRKINEPDTFTWEPIQGHYATVRELYHGMLCVRYISDRRIEEGNDQTDKIVLLARNNDTDPSPSLCVPVFYTSGGGVYNVTAEVWNKGKDGAVKVTGCIDGNGGHRRETYLHYQDFKFVRFAPARARPVKRRAMR